MAECPVKNVTKDSQGEEMQLTSGTIHTKGNVVIFAMDGSEIAIDALKCEYFIAIAILYIEKIMVKRL